MPADGQPFDLTDLEAEVRLLAPVAAPQGSLQLDARDLAARLGHICFHSVVAVNESVLLNVDGHELVLRVAVTNTLTAKEQADVIGYHCYRGRVTPDTAIYLREFHVAPSSSASSLHGSTQPMAEETASPAIASQPIEADVASRASSTGAGSAAAGSDHDASRPGPSAHVHSSGDVAGAAECSRPLRLINAVTRAAQAPTNVVKCFTRDGEWFPVKRALLRPCIALTAALRAAGTAGTANHAAAAAADGGDGAAGPHDVHVDVDTLTFDRVLIFLEAEALGKPTPTFSAHLLDDLLAAAQVRPADGVRGFPSLRFTSA